MTLLSLPYAFDNDIDAYRVKNTIENVTSISVSIVNSKKNDEISYTVLVEESNFNKALIILNREISIIEYYKNKDAVEKSQETNISLGKMVNSTENYVTDFFHKRVELFMEQFSLRKILI